MISQTCPWCLSKMSSDTRQSVFYTCGTMLLFDGSNLQSINCKSSVGQFNFFDETLLTREFVESKNWKFYDKCQCHKNRSFKFNLLEKDGVWNAITYGDVEVHIFACVRTVGEYNRLCSLPKG